MNDNVPTARERLLSTPGDAPPAALLRCIAETLAAALQERDTTSLATLPHALLEIASEIEVPRNRLSSAFAAVIQAIQAADTQADLDEMLLAARVLLANMSADERSRVCTEYLLQSARLGRPGK